MATPTDREIEKALFVLGWLYDNHDDYLPDEPRNQILRVRQLLNNELDDRKREE